MCAADAVVEGLEEPCTIARKSDNRQCPILSAGKSGTPPRLLISRRLERLTAAATSNVAVEEDNKEGER